MMSDLKSIAEQTRDWLQHRPGERFTPDHFFGVAWLRHKIVSLGERHDEAPQRDFVARMVRHWGGPHIGLALEIQASQQAAISRYMQSGAPLPEQWFSSDPRFRAILTAARETRTRVIAMDQTHTRLRLPSGPVLSSGRLDRDGHMASAVAQLAREKSKVLVLAGMEHSKEASFGGKSSMGTRLGNTFGRKIYTIYAMTQTGHGNEIFFKTMKAAFGSHGALAFDVDRSPLARGVITDSAIKRTMAWKEYCDGLMLFFTA